MVDVVKEGFKHGNDIMLLRSIFEKVGEFGAEFATKFANELERHGHTWKGDDCNLKMSMEDWDEEKIDMETLSCPACHGTLKRLGEVGEEEEESGSCK